MTMRRGEVDQHAAEITLKQLRRLLEEQKNALYLKDVSAELVSRLQRLQPLAYHVQQSPSPLPAEQQLLRELSLPLQKAEAALRRCSYHQLYEVMNKKDVLRQLEDANKSTGVTLRGALPTVSFLSRTHEGQALMSSFLDDLLSSLPGGGSGGGSARRAGPGVGEGGGGSGSAKKSGRWGHQAADGEGDADVRQLWFVEMYVNWSSHALDKQAEVEKQKKLILQFAEHKPEHVGLLKDLHQDLEDESNLLEDIVFVDASESLTGSAPPSRTSSPLRRAPATAAAPDGPPSPSRPAAATALPVAGTRAAVVAEAEARVGVVQALVETVRAAVDKLELAQEYAIAAPAQYLCPRSHTLMWEPVVYKGVTYDRAAIEKWYWEQQSRTAGPRTELVDVVSDLALEREIHTWARTQRPFNALSSPMWRNVRVNWTPLGVGKAAAAAGGLTGAAAVASAAAGEAESGRYFPPVSNHRKENSDDYPDGATKEVLVGTLVQSPSLDQGMGFGPFGEDQSWEAPVDEDGGDREGSERQEVEAMLPVKSAPVVVKVQSPQQKSAAERERVLAERGDGEAMNRLGWRYLQGDGVQQQLSQAVHWFKLSAEAECPAGECSLATCYESGWGVPADPSTAAELFRSAANKGSAQGANGYGRCCLLGHGVRVDKKAAVDYFNKAASQDLPAAHYNLGRCYQEGWGVRKDDTQGVACFERAAESGDLFATTELGRCYEGGVGVPVDSQHALSLYRSAAAAGHPQAQNALGESYRKGRCGVEKDVGAAVKYFQLAAAQGFAPALCNLARCYERGEGVAWDAVMAEDLYLRAKRQGCQKSSWRLRFSLLRYPIRPPKPAVRQLGASFRRVLSRQNSEQFERRETVR